jgi:hypothetical protein
MQRQKIATFDVSTRNRIYYEFLEIGILVTLRLLNEKFPR